MKSELPWVWNNLMTQFSMLVPALPSPLLTEIYKSLHLVYQMREELKKKLHRLDSAHVQLFYKKKHVGRIVIIKSNLRYQSLDVLNHSELVLWQINVCIWKIHSSIIKERGCDSRQSCRWSDILHCIYATVHHCSLSIVLIIFDIWRTKLHMFKKILKQLVWLKEEDIS